MKNNYDYEVKFEILVSIQVKKIRPIDEPININLKGEH